MTTDEGSTYAPTSFHWGAYDAEVRQGRIVRMVPNPQDPHPSAIGRSIADSVTSPSRVMRPMVRKRYLDNGPQHGNNTRGADPFVAVSWEEGLALAASALGITRALYGNEAIYGGSYGWASAGRFHHSIGQVHRFLNLFGGYVDHVNSYSYGALEVILPHVVGDTLRFRADLPTWQEIAEHTKLFVAFGGLPLRNTQVNAGGLLRHTARDDMQAAHDAGVKFVYIGPARDDVADSLNSQWISIRPHTDVAFMLAIAHVMITENLHDQDFVKRCCIGFDTLSDYILGKSDGQPKTPAWASAIADCDPAVIFDLARRMAGQRTLISLIWSIQRADHGEQPCWMATALAAMTGSFGKVGGGLGLGYGSVHGYASAAGRLKAASFPQGENPVTDFFPVARLAHVLENPGAPLDYNGQTLTCPDIRLIYWAGGNPFHHHQDINKLLRAWQIPETIIVHEPFWTATARHADIVFPATTALERNDIAVGEGCILAMHQAIEPVGESLSDHAILAALADVLDFGPAFTEGRSEKEWLIHMYEQTRSNAAASGLTLPPFETFWDTSVINLPVPPRPAPMFADFRNDPEAHPLKTVSGRLELFSPTIASFGYDDCPGHPTWLEPSEWLGSEKTARFPIHMLSSQPTTRLHSQYDGGAFSQESKIQGREPIRIQTQDAEARGIKTGNVVRVFNDRGAFLAGAIVSDALRPHVAHIATGAWYDPLVPGQIGTLDVHGNPNMVSHDRGTSRLAQGSAALTTLVEIEKFTGPLPPIHAFEPPPTVDS